MPWNTEAFEAGKSAGREFFLTGVMPPTPAWVYEQKATSEHNKGIDSGVADARYKLLNEREEAAS